MFIHLLDLGADPLVKDATGLDAFDILLHAGFSDAFEEVQTYYRKEHPEFERENAFARGVAEDGEDEEE